MYVNPKLSHPNNCSQLYWRGNQHPARESSGKGGKACVNQGTFWFGIVPDWLERKASLLRLVREQYRTFSSQLRLVHTSDGIGNGVGSARSVTIQCKSKIRIGSGVGSSTESESEGSVEFLFLPIPLPLPSLPIQWEQGERNRNRKRNYQPIKNLITSPFQT